MKSCHCGSQAKTSCPQCGEPLCYGMNCYRTHEEKCRPEPLTPELVEIRREERVSPMMILKRARN